MEETLPRTSPHAVCAEQVAARWHYLSATVTSASGSTVVQSLSQNDVLPGRDKSLHYLTLIWPAFPSQGVADIPSR